MAREIQNMMIDVTAAVRHLRSLPPVEFAKRFFNDLAPVICIVSEYAEEKFADWPVPASTGEER